MKQFKHSKHSEKETSSQLKESKGTSASNRSEHSILQLQKLIGNSAVQRLILNENRQRTKSIQMTKKEELDLGAYGPIPASPEAILAKEPIVDSDKDDSPYKADVADFLPSIKSAADPSEIENDENDNPYKANIADFASSIKPDAPSKYNKKAMEDGMLDFDKNVQGAGTANAGLPSTTLYADTAEKKQPYTRKFVDGKMVDSEGKSVDSIGAEKAAADAGELQVREGQVEMFSDNSGHYKPGAEQMLQTAKELEAQKAGIEGIGAEFVGKKRDQKTVKSSALEILGYEKGEEGGKGFKGGAETIESEIRENHAKKDTVMEEFLAKTQKRK